MKKLALRQVRLILRTHLVSGLTFVLLTVAGVDSAGADTITLKSDASTLAARLGPGAPSPTVRARLDTADTTDLSFVPVLVGSFGTFTPVPRGAPGGTAVVNIPPGDGENGYFKMSFTLPSAFSDIQLTGSANVDDFGRVFLNGNPISPSILSGDPLTVTEYANATFSNQNASFFQPGENVILISDANTGNPPGGTGGPSGGAFFITITFSVLCGPGPANLSLCLSSGRFRVTATWQSPTASGVGTAVGLTPDTGYFWFFNSTNVEMIVKVLDACAVNSKKWVFAGGLTNVAVTMTVTDTQTGATRTYTNLQGVAFQPIQDTSAFATCP